MPNVGIVAADARVAEIEEAVDVLDQITGDETELGRPSKSSRSSSRPKPSGVSWMSAGRSPMAEEFMEDTDRRDGVEWRGPPTLNEF